MSFNTDRLIKMDELTIETARLIRKGMKSDEAIRQVRIIIQERKISGKFGHGGRDQAGE